MHVPSLRNTGVRDRTHQQDPVGSLRGFGFQQDVIVESQFIRVFGLLQARLPIKGHLDLEPGLRLGPALIIAGPLEVRGLEKVRLNLGDFVFRIQLRDSGKTGTQKNSAQHEREGLQGRHDRVN